jgi:chromosome segregation ATPase
MKYTESTEIKDGVLVFTRESTNNPPETFKVDTRSNVFRHAMGRLGWLNPDEVTDMKLNQLPAVSDHAVDAAAYLVPKTAAEKGTLVHENIELQRQLFETQASLHNARQTIKSFGMPQPLSNKQLQQLLQNKARRDSDNKSAQIGHLDAQLINQKATAAHLRSDNEKLKADKDAIVKVIGRLEDQVIEQNGTLELRAQEVSQLTKDLAIAHDEIKRLRETGCNAVLANRIAELERKIGGQP